MPEQRCDICPDVMYEILGFLELAIIKIKLLVFKYAELVEFIDHFFRLKTNHNATLAK